MVNRQVVLVLMAVTLFGSLSGFIAALITPVQYQAEAYVVVYEMPRGFTDVLSPDEAAHLADVYRAGVLQNGVINLVQKSLPDYTADQIAQSIQVELVAYTPLTRITATSATPEAAAVLANVVAQAWTTVAGAAIDHAYAVVESTLEARESDLLQQIKTVQNALAANPSPDVAAQLQSQLSVLQNSLGETAAAILGLDLTQFDVAGNAYVQIAAKPSEAVKSPDPVKDVGVGAGIGVSLGLMLALWLMARRWKSVGARQVPQATVSRVAGVEAFDGH